MKRTLILIIAILCFSAAGVLFWLSKKPAPQTQPTSTPQEPSPTILASASPTASPANNPLGQLLNPVSAPKRDKIVIADFYWWYPWYGMQYPNPSGSGLLPPRTDGSGNTVQDAFRYTFSEHIPYLSSAERSQGAQNPQAAVAWFKGNFQRAANAGIDVMAVMTRPDLGEWKNALRYMIQAQKELRQENKKYPRLLFHFDGVEYWDKQSPASGQLTGPGSHYDVIWSGVQDTMNTITAEVAPNPLSDYFFLYPGTTDTLPIFVYRIEGNAHDFATSGWWVDRLKLDFTSQYGKKLYVILDDFWCNHQYGVNNTVQTHTCNADNYYHWGAALEGTQIPSGSVTPKILTVGPGFDNSVLVGAHARTMPRQNGTFYTSNLNKAVALGANWILLETFNFGEEGTAIDQTTGKDSFGTQYLDLTRAFTTQWR